MKKSELYGNAIMYIMKYIREANCIGDEKAVLETVQLLCDQRHHQLWCEEQEEKKARPAVVVPVVEVSER